MIAVLPLLLLSLLAAPASAQPSQQTIEHVMNLVREMSRAPDRHAWLAANKAQLTRENAAAGDLIAREAMRANKQGLAFAASEFAAFAHLNAGEPGPALRSMVDQHQVRFMLAEKSPEYVQLRQSCLDMAKRAEAIARQDIAFEFQTIAADSSYFQSKALKDKTAEQAMLTTLADLIAVLPLSKHSSRRMFYERLISLTGAAVKDSTAEYHLEQDRFDVQLRKLAAATEQFIPPDFDFESPVVGNTGKAIEVARHLAELSYTYGAPAVASARLAIAEQRARQFRDPQFTVGLLHLRYRGEQRSGVPADQLRKLRQDAWASAQAIRSAYRSRAGRIWAAYRSDELYGDMLKGELADNQSQQSAFRFAESLKARMLLDRLTASQATELDTPQTQTIEQQILGFAPPEASRDILASEMGLVSQLTGFVGCGDSGEADSRESSLRQLEDLYSKASAGFTQTANPVGLEAVRQRLRPREALLEYVIPYNPLHPASDLWMFLISRDAVRTAHLPLDKVLGLAEGFTGRMCIDGRSPIDSSALGQRISLLRVAIRTADEKKARQGLQDLHTILIQPLLAQGVRLDAFDHITVVPHSVLHYVPFAALLDPAGAFLISKVALSIAPSASVWSILRSRDPAPGPLLALANPALGGAQHANLPFAEQEATGIAKTKPSPTVLLREKATKQALLQLAPTASLIHLSTHGDFPSDSALNLHAVWLSSPNGRGVPLRAADVRALRLNAAPLVILNVCNGGLYRIGPSDEPYGLIPAFLEAGARNVLSTLWSMDDEFGRDFMIEFYRHLDAGPAAAYRKTAQRFIAEDEFIRRWAGYLLIGPGL